MAAQDLLRLVSQGASLLDRTHRLLNSSGGRRGASDNPSGEGRRRMSPDELFQVANRVLDALESPNRRSRWWF